MSSNIFCEIESFESPHLNQLYAGFIKLKNQGKLDLKIKKSREDHDLHKPVIKVKLNNQYKVVYDTLDGLNWIEGTDEDNLNYFQEKFQNIDYYFKRSYSPILNKYAPTNCRIIPLGLWYEIEEPKEFMERPFRKFTVPLIRKKKLLRKLFNISQYNSSGFEYYPILPAETQVIHFTRLWDPEEVKLNHLKVEREKINQLRIESIRKCKKEFGKIFKGGLSNNEFTKKHAPDLILSNLRTDRSSYLELVRNSTICITTTGLHNSIGGKLGEFIAASRAILTEPLEYEVPGNLQNDKNYIEFNNSDDLLMKIDYLLNNKDIIKKMMYENYYYYNNFLKPENLIVNSLLNIL
ncbi:hypothetical protein KY321_02820 [Candidatus Woesearchaeota archaeon]|nr:hypothetical protein [Candidatus Woesearchaeota archaeon]